MDLGKRGRDDIWVQTSMTHLTHRGSGHFGAYRNSILYVRLQVGRYASSTYLAANLKALGNCGDMLMLSEVVAAYLRTMLFIMSCVQLTL